MRSKKKRARIRRKLAAQDALDVRIREAKIHRFRLSAPDGFEELEEILRALEETPVRRVVVGPECHSYPATPLWIEPSPQGPFTNPTCAGSQDAVFSMA
jgi:hypothetical protein